MNQNDRTGRGQDELKGHAGQGGQSQFRADERQGKGQQDESLRQEHRSFQGDDSDPAEGLRASRSDEGETMQGQRGTEGGESVEGGQPGVGRDPTRQFGQAGAGSEIRGEEASEDIEQEDTQSTTSNI